jgi:hypothetical protein
MASPGKPKKQTQRFPTVAAERNRTKGPALETDEHQQPSKKHRSSSTVEGRGKGIQLTYSTVERHKHQNLEKPGITSSSGKLNLPTSQTQNTQCFHLNQYKELIDFSGERLRRSDRSERTQGIQGPSLEPDSTVEVDDAGLNKKY